jgi:hypothetical protein
MPLIFIPSGQQNGFKFAAVTAERPIESDHPTPAHGTWQRGLRSYTHALLTNPGDKLIALSGIASEPASNLSNDYAASLWTAYMATELLRYVDHDTTTKRPAKYRAPSFFWASVHGAVIPGESQEGDILVEVLNASAQVETSNPFGSVDNGSVRLRGTLKLALLGLNPLLRQGITFPRRPKACPPTANR